MSNKFKYNGLKIQSKIASLFVTPITPSKSEGVINYSNLQRLEHKGYRSNITPVTLVTPKK